MYVSILNDSHAMMALAKKNAKYPKYVFEIEMI